MVSPGKAGGFNCEPLKAALDVAATRPLGPPSGWLLHPDGFELADAIPMPTPRWFRPGPSQRDRTASSISRRGSWVKTDVPPRVRQTGGTRHSDVASSTLRSIVMGAPSRDA